MNLKHLNDKTLLRDAKKLVHEERECTVTILYHLKEIERRRLFADLGFGSLFEYVTKELGYTESAAARRINSARLLNEIPAIDKKISNGEISLTNLSKAAKLFKRNSLDQTTKKSIISQIENKSTRECEKMLSIFEEKEIPTEKVKILTPEVSSLTVTLTEKTLKNLEKLKGHLAHKRLNNDELFNYIFNLALEKLLIDKYHLNTSGRNQESTTRYIPTEIRKRVYLRDKGRCQNCKSVYKVEFDHILPFSMGGKSSEENLRLLCFSCNQRARIKNGNSYRV
jgi:hypothetical protein